MYRARFVPLLLIAVIGMAPISLAMSWAMLWAIGGGDSTAELAALGGLMLLSFLPMVLVYSALTWGAARAAEGDSVPVGRAYAVAVRTFPSLLGSWVLLLFYAVIGFFASILGAVVIASPFFVLGGFAGEALGIVLMAFGGLAGFLAWVVGYGLLLGMWFAVLPLIVLDRMGPIRSIRRSFELSRGARFKILAVLVVAWLIMLLPSMGIQMMLLGPVATFDPAAGANMPATMLALQGLGNFLATILTAPFLVACLVTLYFDRRVAAEGLDLQRAVEAMERRDHNPAS